MATGKNHSIRHDTPGDVARYCDAINVSCDAPEEEHKLWVKEQGVCTNQGPQAQLSMMLHSLHKEASALLCEAVQGNVCVFLCIPIFEDQRHILHICQILHIIQIRITGQASVCPSEQTAGTKKIPLQIPSFQAAIFQAFESTHGTAPRFDASLHTAWLQVALTTRVTML
jgi:hypothetical protein